jgi:hypothetical protein
VPVTLFKEVSYSLSKLIEDIEAGEIALPEIQRPFVWSRAKVRDLFDSMYNGFPVGYLLFWASMSGNGSRQIGVGEKQARARLLIVDGQLRLTSLYAVLKGYPIVAHDYSQDRIRIAFRPGMPTLLSQMRLLLAIPSSFQTSPSYGSVTSHAIDSSAGSSSGSAPLVSCRTRKRTS